MRTAIERGKSITLQIDGQAVAAFEGETIAAVLLAGGRRVFRRTVAGQPRGLFCGMGICYDCLVTVNGTANRRACVTPAADGMVVDTHTGLSVEA
jgi:predicted molibdopterin-dependent oxidoreductase YjgC